MAVWQVTDKEIESVEELLLPDNAHFSDDAREVIRCWDSCEVSACPGCGKTTILLAKLKILVDHMPFEDGSGVCVLSHTNVAVNEIKSRLSANCETIFGYPNYVGTIQSFIDRFVTMPYLKQVAGRVVQPIDDRTYSQYMLSRMTANSGFNQYRSLNFFLKTKYDAAKGRYSDRAEHISKCLIGTDDALYVEEKKIAGSDSNSAKQFVALKKELLRTEGIITYRDAYYYAEKAIDELTESYSDLFAARFRYVMIDEYQDCNELQRQALCKIFSPHKTCVIHIGDPDQAIFLPVYDKSSVWKPADNCLTISVSNRYSQEIANVLCRLKTGKQYINTLVGETGQKPILFVYEKKKIAQVLDAFISALERRGLIDPGGTYKAIGYIRNNKSTGIKIGDYWSDFDSAREKINEFGYWTTIRDISESLKQGRLYRAEQLVRKLLCRIFHYLKVINEDTGKEYTNSSLKNKFCDKYSDWYRNFIYNLSQLNSFAEITMDVYVRENFNMLIKLLNLQCGDIFSYLPKTFLEKPVQARNIEGCEERNVFKDPIRKRKIIFDTIHGVKGETHDATLYLETETRGGSDLKRILPYLGVGKVGTSYLYDYSRRLAYVGMSRPRKLLCVAMQSDTYEKGKNAFNEWEIVDLRKQGTN